MKVNIYYFGRRGDDLIRHSVHQRMRSLQSARNRQSLKCYSQQNRSNSSRKTEALHLFKRKQLNLQSTHLSSQQRGSWESLSDKKEKDLAYKWKRNKNNSASIDNIAKGNIKIAFRRVEQAKRQDKHGNHNKNATPNGALKVENLERPTLSFSMRSSHTSHSNHKQPSYLNSLYKTQPEDRLFLCNACRQFLPLIQIKNHHSNCTPPCTQADLLFQWCKIIALIKEISTTISIKNDSLSRLVQLMEQYASRGYFAKDQNAVLHSDALSRILSYQPTTCLKYVDSADLFQVIESLGDRLEGVGESLDGSVIDLCC